MDFTSSFPISFSQPSCLSVEQHGAGGLLTPLTAQGRGCLHARLCAEAEGYSCVLCSLCSSTFLLRAEEEMLCLLHALLAAWVLLCCRGQCDPARGCI